MPLFKKVSGNYVDVVDVLELPKAYYAPQTRSAYKAQIEKDLPRTAYVSYQKTTSQMQDDYRNDSLLEDRDLSFTQGNFEGGVFTDTQIKTSPKFMEVAGLSANVRD